MFINWILIWIMQLGVFLTADQPVFKGGHRNLNSFIASNLIYPEYARQNCLQGTIQVSFKLDKQGRVFDSEVQKGYGIDLDDEALRLVRLTSGKWIVPADYDTTVSLVLPINFSLREFKCEQRSRDNIKEAINAYKARQDLAQAVFNFYDKKASGDYNAADEVRILQLKNQLGFDDKYINSLLKQAQRKLKQGDKESACEDFQTVRKLGSDKAEKWILENCR